MIYPHLSTNVRQKQKFIAITHHKWKFVHKWMLWNSNMDEKVICPWSTAPGYVFILDKKGHWPINTLRQRQNGRHFAGDIFKYIFLNENAWIPIKIALKFVAKGPIDNILALVQIMAWHRQGDKPLSEPMVFSLPTHISVTRPQWVNETPRIHCLVLDIRVS